MIALITPTGARKRQIQLCAKWMAKQTYKKEVLWIIVDDAIPVTTDFIESDFRDKWEIVKLYPNDPAWLPGMNTQGRNLRAGIEEIERRGDEITHVFIIEDDDYYSPKYLTEMMKRFKNNDIIGEMNSVYYNINTGKCYINKSMLHSSLFQTGFKVSIIPEFKRATYSKTIDMDFWKDAKCEKELFRLEKPFSIGVKGIRGRNGIGAGHYLGKDVKNKNIEVVSNTVESFIGKTAAKHYILLHERI